MSELRIHHTLQCKDLQIEADRDSSRLRINILMPNGMMTSIDCYGAMIAKLQKEINLAIQVVPGLLVWKGQDYTGPTAEESVN